MEGGHDLGGDHPVVDALEHDGDDVLALEDAGVLVAQVVGLLRKIGVDLRGKLRGIVEGPAQLDLDVPAEEVVDAGDLHAEIGADEALVLKGRALEIVPDILAGQLAVEGACLADAQHRQQRCHAPDQHGLFGSLGLLREEDDTQHAEADQGEQLRDQAGGDELQHIVGIVRALTGQDQVRHIHEPIQHQIHAVLDQRIDKVEAVDHAVGDPAPFPGGDQGHQSTQQHRPEEGQQIGGQLGDVIQADGLGLVAQPQIQGDEGQHQEQLPDQHGEPSG